MQHPAATSICLLADGDCSAQPKRCAPNSKLRAGKHASIGETSHTDPARNHPPCMQHADMGDWPHNWQSHASQICKRYVAEDIKRAWVQKDKHRASTWRGNAAMVRNHKDRREMPPRDRRLAGRRQRCGRERGAAHCIPCLCRWGVLFATVVLGFRS